MINRRKQTVLVFLTSLLPTIGMVAFAVLVHSFTSSPARSEAEARFGVECFPIATLKVSFQVVFPNAKQVTLDGEAARAYLSEYNNFGRPTEFSGDTLFMNILPNGTTMLIPLNDGIGCNRMIVGPKLHKVIMTKVNRGAI